jgi:hypothetical protein
MDWILGLIRDAGGSLVDMLIAVVIFLICLIAFFAFKWIRTKIISTQNNQDIAFANLEISMKRAFEEIKAKYDKALDEKRQTNEKAHAEIKRSNDEHIASMNSVIHELKEGKTWSETCMERHIAIENTYKALERRVSNLESQVLELQKQPKGRAR